MKVGIAVDNWKLHIFRRRLKDAGYSYDDGVAFSADTTVLTVETDDTPGLQQVIDQCQAECRAKKHSKWN